MAVTDRIELHANQKSLKILNICGAVYLLTWLVMILMADNFRGEYLKLLMTGVMFWSLLGSLWSKDAGLFIEWTAEQIEFKTHKESGVVAVSRLKYIEVGLDEIKLHLEDGEVQVVNIARFSDYETRLKIKAHFSELQQELKTV